MLKKVKLLFLENVRVNKGEKKNDPELGKKYAALCDVFVMDDVWYRSPCSSINLRCCRICTKSLVRVQLLAAELDALGKALKEPARPMVAIVGGSKVSTKLEVLKFSFKNR